MTKLESPEGRPAAWIRSDHRNAGARPRGRRLRLVQFLDHFRFVGRSSGASSSTAASSGSASTSAAAAALTPYKALPTTINITTPLKSAPPSGKTIVMLGTNNPSNVIIQQGLAKLAQMAHWNYSLVSYDPANPGTFTQAETTALAKHPQYLVEAGLPLTASQLAMAKSAGAKWILDSVYPVSVTAPVIGQVDAYAQDALMGKITADYFISDSGGKGNAVIEHVPAYPILDGFTTGLRERGQGAVPGVQDSRPRTSRSPTWSRERSRATWCRRSGRTRRRTISCSTTARSPTASRPPSRPPV